MLEYQIFVQSLAVVAVVLFVISFHAKTRKTILLLQLLSLCIWSSHFLLIEALTGMSLLLINIAATVLFYFKGKLAWLDTITLPLALCAFTLATALSWEGFYSVFAFLGVTAITIAKWQDDPKRIRMVAIFASIAWIMYDIFVQSYGGIVAEILILISILISLRRGTKDGTG